MSLTNAKAPSLKDKLAAQERDAKEVIVAAEAEIKAVKKAKKRASKKN